MSNTKHYPADRKGTSHLDWDGKPLFKGKMHARVPLNTVVQSMNLVLENTDQLLDLATLIEDYYNHAKLDKAGKEKFAYLFNLIGTDILAIYKQLGKIGEVLEGEDDSITEALYRLKANADDENPGYIADKVTTQQPGNAVVVNNNEVVIIGTLPPRSIFFIPRSEVVHFDTTGKGKEQSPFWGFAYANGQNGTDNVMKDMYLKLTADPNNANIEGGRSNFTVKSGNLETTELAVSGTVSSGLGVVNPAVQIKSGTIPVPTGGSSTNKNVYLPEGTTGNTLSGSVDLAHNHQFNMTAKHTNASPVPIDLNPLSITLIPIQKINV